MDWRISVGVSVLGFIFAFAYAYYYGHNNWVVALKESGSSLIALGTAHGAHGMANSYRRFRHNHYESLKNEAK